MLADAVADGGSGADETEGVVVVDFDTVGVVLGVGATGNAPATLGVGEADAEMLSEGDGDGVFEEENEGEVVCERVVVAD